jgi:hypothetical protein
LRSPRVPQTVTGSRLTALNRLPSIPLQIRLLLVELGEPWHHWAEACAATSPGRMAQISFGRKPSRANDRTAKTRGCPQLRALYDFAMNPVHEPSEPTWLQSEQSKARHTMRSEILLVDDFELYRGRPRANHVDGPSRSVRKVEDAILHKWPTVGDRHRNGTAIEEICHPDAGAER